MNNLNHKTDHLWIDSYQFKRKVQEACAPCTYFYQSQPGFCPNAGLKSLSCSGIGYR